MASEFSYHGKQVRVAINDAGDAATIDIDGKMFETMLHTEGSEEDNFIKLWMCPGSYVMTESPELMAKNIIDYWHQYTEAGSTDRGHTDHET